MEMPEGLIRLESELTKKKLSHYNEEDKYNENGGWCSPIGCTCFCDEEYVVMFLKEAIQALEYYKNIDLTVNFGAPEQFNEMFHRRANNILGRMEWWK